MASSTGRSVCFQFAENGTCTFGANCKFSHDGRGRSAWGTSHKNRSGRKRPIRSTETPLDEFFAEYSSFPYDESAPAMTNFYALCDFFGWDKDDIRKQEARNRFKDALVLQFNNIYGTDVDDINSWHSLCQVLNIVPIPDDLEECRSAVKRTHVNIVDLVDERGAHVRVFDSEEALSIYTKESGKFFPKENAYAGGVLKFLLRQILSPPAAPRRGRRRR